MNNKEKIEEGLEFIPKFNEKGLITAIAQDIQTNQVLMVAYMNKNALQATLDTGYATYYSRSRQKLWQKGEQSGHRQKVEQILVDCDQDCLVLKVSIDAGQCHVGYKSCFYRAINTDDKHSLEFIAKKVYNPEDVYEK